MPNDLSESTVSIKVLEKIFNIIPYGLAVYNQHNTCIVENKTFSNLGTIRPKFNVEDIKGTTYLPIEFNRTADTPAWATIQNLDENLVLVTINESENIFTSDVNAFRLMLEAHTRGYDIYQSAALAIGLSTGWRWVGISRLTDSDRSVEVLGFWDSNKLTDVFSYELAKTPCEKVFASQSVCEFSPVCDLFPEDDMLIDLGAVSYVGKVYKIDGCAYGHILMMSDKPQMITVEIEAILASFAGYIGSRLEVFHHIQRTEEANELANTDKLTGLGNRLALEKTIRQCKNAHNAKKISNVLIAFIDLDGMKAINDAHGHERGDIMLQTFSRHLLQCCSTHDVAFRLGGDEFIWVFKDPPPSAAQQVKDHLDTVVNAVQAAGFTKMGASVGIAYLAENHWEFEEALREADVNMYADKRTKKLKRDREEFLTKTER